MGHLAAFALLILLGAALFGERLAPNEAIYFVVEHGADPRPYEPGIVFPLGSDVLGRDLLSLVLAGARTTIGIVALAGIARVLAAMAVLGLEVTWRPAAIGIQALAELVSAVPATLVALVLMKAFAGSEASVEVFIGALLVMGWSGPYRVLRAELARLATSPFVDGARAIGVTRLRLLWRHMFPQLVPTIVVSLSLQVIASLVLVAELAVLGVSVGSTRYVDIAESVSRLRPELSNAAFVPDVPEWGALLAGARTVEALWVTRWLIFVPAVGFALAAIAAALIGHALAGRYAERDVFEDLKRPAAGGLLLVIVGLFIVSSAIPERYAEAREWARGARSAVKPEMDPRAALSEAGLDVTEIRRDVVSVLRSGPATVSVGGVDLTELWPIPTAPEPNTVHIRSLVSEELGGSGMVEAPLVFAARGIVPSEYTLPPPRPFGVPPVPQLATFIKDYADDYADIDVRGKIVLLVRFMGVDNVGRFPRLGNRARGPSFDVSIAGAIKRGAAGVIFVDPALGLYTETALGFTYARGRIAGGINPYSGLERSQPRTTAAGVPVLVLSPAAAATLTRPLGLDLTPLLDYDEPDTVWERSAARELGVSAKVDVPLERRSASTTTYVGEVPGAPSDAMRVLVWTPRRPESKHPSSDVIVALAREFGRTEVPLTLVDFDVSIDPRANAAAVGEALKHRRVGLVLVVDRLDGTALRFTTPYGEFVPALDLYAEHSGARFERTLRTANIDTLSGVAPFIQTKTIVVTGNELEGDLRSDAAALIGYLLGRLTLGAPELPR